MIRRQLVAFVSISLLLPLAAGCDAEKSESKDASKAGANTGAASAQESTKQQSIEMRRREENMIAACMKRSGFEYVPYVPPEMLNPPAPKPTDYASLKAFRTKYGFGTFAPHVYPGDPKLAGPAEDKDPNSAILDGLDEVQKKAYLTAYDGYTVDKSGPLKLTGGCVAEAVKAVDPRSWARAKYRHDLVNGVRPDENSPEFKKRCDTDPACKNYDADEARLKPLRDAYMACLKRNGYLADEFNFEEVASAAVVERWGELDQDPDVFKAKIDPAVARTELQKEIKVALEDLECGKDYIATNGEIEARNRDLSPPSGGLP